MGNIGAFNIIFATLVFFLPTFIAFYMKHPHRIYICLVNLAGGLIAGIGWFVALGWIFYNPKDNKCEKST
ncbi:superinfection immunity protein [Paraferrimonas haliotis]|uniref:superinfection immunity protein n=1 Tax=Paraferrimonas haliotis TaxID=2013866 RepID=UPI000BA9919B